MYYMYTLKGIKCYILNCVYHQLRIFHTNLLDIYFLIFNKFYIFKNLTLTHIITSISDQFFIKLIKFLIKKIIKLNITSYNCFNKQDLE